MPNKFSNHFLGNGEWLMVDGGDDNRMSIDALDAGFWYLDEKV